MTQKELNAATKRYNEIMYSVCHEPVTIGTIYSEGTEGWNLRDMVSEMQYTLDIWNDEGSIAWMDAHDEFQPKGRPWYHNWYNEKARMKRFIDRYKDEALKLECVDGHCSKFD